MAITATVLRELHRIHRQISDLTSRLERGPKQTAASDALAKNIHVRWEQAKGELTKLKMAGDERQLQLKQREDRIEDLKRKLNSCGSNREFQALKEQIAADEQANSVLSDEILELLEQIDEQVAKVDEAAGEYEKYMAEAEKTRKRVAEERPGLESELARVQEELRKAEALLPADFRAEYHRVAKVRGEQTLAEVDGDCCGSCYQVLTPQTLNELSMSRPVACKSCGCLLYLPEDRLPGP